MFLIVGFFFFFVSDKGRAQKKGVLVHCLAGISRSVTVMLAYLMAHRQLTLNEAYNMVLKRKANIDPNFHFMQQLHSFEKQLLDARQQQHPRHQQQQQLANSTSGPSTTSSYLSPLSTAVQSPDSGIEFDRWTPGTGGWEMFEGDHQRSPQTKYHFWPILRITATTTTIITTILLATATIMMLSSLIFLKT